MPASYVDETTGLAVGRWLRGLRKKKASLTPEQMELLEAIHFAWTDPAERRWEQAYSACREYYSNYGNLRIPSTRKGRALTEASPSSKCEARHNIDLAKWLSRQRRLRNEGKLSTEKIEKLDANCQAFMETSWHPQSKLS